jgi:hypothetical protein
VSLGVFAAVPGPSVILDVELIDGALMLVLTNCGSDVAHQPRVTFSPRLVGEGGQTVVSQLPLWTRLSMLAPGRRIEVFLDSARLTLRGHYAAKQFTAQVTFEDDKGREHTATFDHDLTAYAGITPEDQ